MAIPLSRAGQPDAIRLPLESPHVAPARSRPLWLVAIGVVLSVGVVLGSRSSSGLVWHGLSVACIGIVVGLVCVLTGVGLQRLRHVRRSPVACAWLSIDEVEIARVDERGKTGFVRWGEPFGLSVLANTARSRGLLVFTTPVATRLLGLGLDTPKDADGARDLMLHAITVPDADLELATGPGSDVRLSAASARVLLGELLRRDDQAMQRIYLSDAKGTAIAVERESLQVGGHSFDLSAPIDWRVFTFNEGEPGVLTLYQATSLRQGGKELVLVCRAPAELASWGVGRAVDAPPAREARVAIDRLFMTPLRATLERAPRVSRSGPASRTQGKSVET